MTVKMTLHSNFYYTTIETYKSSIMLILMSEPPVNQEKPQKQLLDSSKGLIFIAFFNIYTVLCYYNLVP